jgi:hypothetical protein
MFFFRRVKTKQKYPSWFHFAGMIFDALTVAGF